MVDRVRAWFVPAPRPSKRDVHQEELDRILELAKMQAEAIGVLCDLAKAHKNYLDALRDAVRPKNKQ
jgi:hypothetical protein